jgi:hypothetical protein
MHLRYFSVHIFKYFFLFFTSYNFWVDNKFGSLFRPYLTMKVDKGLIALTPEIDCNKTAMGLPPVTSAVFLIAN